MLKLSVVTPEKRLLELDCEEVSLPGASGYIGILPGHAALLSTLGTGEIGWRNGSKWSWGVVQGGFCEVGNDRVNVLADIAEEAGSIDVSAAKSAQAEAEERMKTAGEEELRRANAAVELNRARVSAASK